MLMLDLTMGSRVRRLGAAALGSVAVLGACVIEGGPGPTATELYALIDLHCERATLCSCAFAAEEGACTSELEARWKARLSEAQRRDLRYDAACLATLTAQIEEQRCYWPDGDVPLCESYCAPFHGDRAEGEDCQGDDALVSDCAQGLACAEGTCTLPCAAINGRLAGEPCANEMVGEYDDCAPGLYCGYPSGRCEVAPAEGDACPAGECGPDLYCDWQTNTCVTASGVGETCFEVPCMDGLYCDWQTDACRVTPGEGEPCFDGPCQPGLYCEWTGKSETGTCLAYAAEGEDCSQLRCEDELWCDDANRCVTAPVEGQPCLFDYLCAEGIVCNLEGLCVAPPTEGQPCASGTCDDDSWCDASMDPTGTGICAPRKANDEMCSGHNQCESGYCPNGFCWARPLDGDACDGSGVCGGGLVCNGTTCEPTVTQGPAACTYLGW